MGKASRWFTKLLGRNNRRRRQSPSDISLPSPSTASFAEYDGGDPNKHAIAVAAATAVVAEAALAAAKAAAEVVRLTSNVPPGHVSRRWSLEDLAAVKVQSVFRGYLARRALRALKGLVKLQALVRGHFVRKQSTDMLRRLQALIRAQDRARVNRVLTLDSNHSQGSENATRSEVHALGQSLPDSPLLKQCGLRSSMREGKGRDRAVCSGMKWLDNWVEAGTSMNSPSSIMKVPQGDDEKSDKILEVDSWKPGRSRRGTSPSQHISAQDYYNRSFAASDYLARYSPIKPSNNPYAEDVASLKSLHFPLETESSPPQAISMDSTTRRSPSPGPSPMTIAMTPMRNEFSRSFLNGYPSPSYMGNTESYRAKVRSQRHRGDCEKGGSSKTKRSLHAFWESRTCPKRNAHALIH